MSAPGDPALSSPTLATSPTANTRPWPLTRSVRSVTILFVRRSLGNGHDSGASTRCPTAQHTTSYSSVRDSKSPSAYVRDAAEGRRASSASGGDGTPDGTPEGIPEGTPEGTPDEGSETRIARVPERVVTPAASNRLLAASRWPGGDSGMIPAPDANSSTLALPASLSATTPASSTPESPPPTTATLRDFAEADPPAAAAAAVRSFSKAASTSLIAPASLLASSSVLSGMAKSLDPGHLLSSAAVAVPTATTSQSYSTVSPDASSIVPPPDDPTPPSANGTTSPTRTAVTSPRT
mmetsp:Transcript_5118/g.23563  ORF Transcript_5118/g.23563 Transcript_5118/m.23563 type:complete len:294 (-) Transcript_5118:449-1330(-)